MSFKIIDSQVNCGDNIFGPHSNLDLYIKNRSPLISSIIVIPTGTHFLKNDEFIEKSCIWEFKKKLIFYKEIIDANGNLLREYTPKSPYFNMNQFVLDKIREINLTQAIKCYFAPKFHPMLDKQEDIEFFIKQNETVAVKIQGIASFCGPTDIPKWFIKLIKKYNKVLFVHTDYGSMASGQDKTDPYLCYITNKNNALNWVIFGLENDLKMCLAHGLRLSYEASKLVNNNSNFIVGIGPDLMLNNEKYSLELNADYIEKLFSLVNLNQLSFSTDYSWNVSYRDQWDNFDWDSHVRIIKYMKEKNLESDIPNVFYNNSSKFFNMF